MKKITDEEIDEAMPETARACWIDGAKWCRGKMEEETRQVTDEQIGRAACKKYPECDINSDEMLQEAFANGAKWHREELLRNELEPSSRHRADVGERKYGQNTHDEKVQEGKEKQPETIQEAHQMMAEGKIKNAAVKDVQEIKDAMRGLYDNALADEEPFRQKQEGADPEWGKPMCDTDLQLRLLAVQKTNSLEEAEMVLRWLKGEK